MTTFAAILAVVVCGGFFFWRYVWFFRNPQRVPPIQPAILSPADGTVVYVKQLDPQHDVLVIKKGVQTKVNDIVCEDMAAPKILIGIFMSPFNVHYNRAPITGVVEFVRHHPAQGKNLSMWCMHLRTVLKLAPYYHSSCHIFQNERTVTKINGRFKGQEIACYVIQIAAKNVNGIDSYVQPGMTVERGAIFGMIRIGSQVDLVMPWLDGMRIKVRPGDKVWAGESILIE